MMIFAAIAILLIALVPGVLACTRGARTSIVLGLSALLPPVVLWIAATLLDRANGPSGGHFPANAALVVRALPVLLSLGAIAGAVALWLRDRRA